MRFKAYLHLEYVLALIIFPSLFLIILGILNIITQLSFDEIDSFDIFLIQFNSYLYRSKIVKCDLPLTLSYNNEIFEVFLDKEGRLVKRPGYEILLFNVYSWDVNQDEEICQIKLIHANNYYEETIQMETK